MEKVFIAWTKKEDRNMNDRENRKSFLSQNNLDNKNDFVVSQIHEDTIVIAQPSNYEQAADGMITDNKQFALFVRVADCVPLLFHDTQNNVIGAAHAGREGTFRKISSKMIDTFISQYNSSVSDIHIYIGPSIGMCCYEVSEAMAQKVQDEYGALFLQGRSINLQKMNEFQLLSKGIPESNIHSSQICTKCNSTDYFSYRKTGQKENFAGVISLL